MRLNPSILECGMERVFLLDVVVGLKHREEDTLAKTAWADEIEKVSSFLHLRYKHSLVSTVSVLTLNPGIIGNAVW